MTKSEGGNKVQTPRLALARLLPRKRMTNARQQEDHVFLLLVEETQRITPDVVSTSPVPGEKHRGRKHGLRSKGEPLQVKVQLTSFCPKVIWNKCCPFPGQRKRLSPLISRS